MSVSESDGTLSDVAVLRWTGYGLAALSVAVFLAGLLWPDFLWMIVLLVIAVVSLVVVFRAPEAFETWGRDGSRGFNLLVGAPVFLLAAFQLGIQFEDYTVPIAGTLVGAFVLLVVGMVVLSRSVMDSPLWFLMVTFVMGAIIGFSALVFVDVVCDGAPPDSLSAPVLDRYVTYSGLRARRTPNYHLRVAPFGARKGASSLNVNYNVYATHSPGGVVCLLEHRGAVGVPWVAPCGG